MTTLKCAFIILSVVFFSCKDKSNSVASEIEIGNLYKSWTNSWEEQILNDTVKIFRPSDYKEFATSRYREVIEIDGNNTCDYLVLDPNDAHHFESGRLITIDQERNIFAILDSNENVYKKFRIIELGQDILKYIIVN